MSDTLQNLLFKFGGELNELKNYTQMMPTEQELISKKELKELRQQYEEEKKIRQELESTLNSKTNEMNQTIKEAQTMKS